MTGHAFAQLATYTAAFYFTQGFFEQRMQRHKQDEFHQGTSMHAGPRACIHRFSNRYRLETYGTREGVGMQVISILVSVVYWPGQGIHCTGAVPVAARQSATSALSAGLLRDFRSIWRAIIPVEQRPRYCASVSFLAWPSQRCDPDQLRVLLMPAT